MNFNFRKKHQAAAEAAIVQPVVRDSNFKNSALFEKFGDQYALENKEMMELKGGNERAFMPIFNFQQGCGGFTPQ